MTDLRPKKYDVKLVQYATFLYMKKVPESQENARVALTISWSSRFTVLGGQEQKKPEIRFGTVAFSG
jgi:hypothetical protein